MCVCCEKPNAECRIQRQWNTKVETGIRPKQNTNEIPSSTYWAQFEKGTTRCGADRLVARVLIHIIIQLRHRFHSECMSCKEEKGRILSLPRRLSQMQRMNFISPDATPALFHGSFKDCCLVMWILVQWCERERKRKQHCTVLCRSVQSSMNKCQKSAHCKTAAAALIFACFRCFEPFFCWSFDLSPWSLFDRFNFPNNATDNGIERGIIALRQQMPNADGL